MEVTDYIGPLSLVPAAVAVILAFTTRNTVFSLAVACLVGVLVAGEGLLGFPTLLGLCFGDHYAYPGCTSGRDHINGYVGH